MKRKICLILFIAIIMIFEACKKEENTTGCGSVTSFSYGGLTYNTITIGDQCWMKENLNIGTKVNGSANQSNNASIEKYCYGDNEANCLTNGGLYQWDEAMQYSQTEGSKGICAEGWHIPTAAEWATLITFLGENPGTKLKNNGSSGFDALLSGCRFSDGTFKNSNQFGYYWSSTKTDAQQAKLLNITSFDATATTSPNYKVLGLSVRCIKN